MNCIFNRCLILILSISIILLIMAGCSSNHTEMSPLVPELSGISDSDSREIASRAILGVYKVCVDSINQDVEIVPVRHADLDMHVNLNPYLLGWPCRDCLRLDAVGINSDNHLALDFGLTHAFQDPSVRPDLNGFDLRGIVVLPGTTTFPLTPYTKAIYDPKTHQLLRGEQPISLNPGALINADGYTPLWDVNADMPVYAKNIPGTLNPFINYFWENNPDPIAEGAPIPLRRFAVGGGWDYKRYIFNLSKLDQVFEFYFIADVSYGQSATWKTRQNPFYRNPQFNIKEAYDVQVNVESNLVTGDITSTCDLTITVKDWQAGAPLVTDPQNPGQNEIDAPSDVKKLTIEAPDLQFGLMSIDTPDSGSGSDADPWVFNAQIRNLKAAVTGTYPVLIGIEDELNDTDQMDLRVFKLIFAEVRSSHVVIDFNPPQRVTNDEHASFLWPKESIALDSGNKPHIVWTDDRTGYHQVYYSYRSSGGVWSNPENISLSDGQAYYATIAIDSLNRGHIVWEDTEGSIEGMNVHYGLKTAPTGLTHHVNLTDFPDNSIAEFPKVVVGSDNEPHIVWTENATNGGNDYDVRYIHLDLSGPSPTPDFTELIGQSNSWEGQPSVALNTSGIPRVFFIRDSGGHKLYLSKKTGSNFQFPTLVSDGPAYWPDSEYSSSNVLYVAFHGGSGASQIMLRYSIDDGTNWESTMDITDGGDMHHVIPDIAIDSFGTVHIVWHEIDISTQIPGQVKYIQYATGGMSDEQPITPEGFPSAFPSLAIDKDNQVHVAVQTFIDDNYEIFYLTSRD